MSDHLREVLNDIHDTLTMAIGILELDGYENDDVRSLLWQALRAAQEAANE